MAYHSALKDELKIDGELDYYAKNGDVVFAWDVTRGVNDLFHRADAIYSEPSWRDGYAKFMFRANQQVGEFKEYLNAIANTINKLAIPSYIVMGKHMRRMLNPPIVVDVQVHGYGALVGVWNTLAPYGVCDLEDLMRFVCARHEMILDFCCGYGNVAKHAQHFICSDVNRKCVYYVAKTFMGYEYSFC